MDPRLLRTYNEELAYLREAAREFGEEHENVAGRLGLNTPNDPDPYVERLLEGVAFLGARVRLKLDDQFPEFTQHLLHAVQPHYLAPSPSMCVVGLEPLEGDASLAEGFRIPRQTHLNATITNADHATVTFRTGHDVDLYPLRIAEAEYLGSRVAVAPFAASAGSRAEAGIRLRIEATGPTKLSEIAIDDLPVYLSGAEDIPGALYRQIAGETVAALARSTDAADTVEGWTTLPLPARHGFTDDCALLPAEHRSFRGYRILSEYFSCPERFLFVNLRGLAKAFAQCDKACDVVLLFSRNEPALANAIAPANFKLFATPAINLFEKQLGRVKVSATEHEFQLMPDRTRPLDFEVFRVIDVQAFGQSNQHSRPVVPLYAFGALLYDWRDALFYVPRLKLRRLSTREQRLRKRTDYSGTETWLSLTAPGGIGTIEEIQELAVRALVTNRELPELIRFGGASHFQIESGPVRAVTILRAPTRPRPPQGLGDSAWRVISHLTPNYATLAPEDHDDPSVLRDHLTLYGRQDEASLRKQIDGILSIRSTPVTRRLPGRGQLAFARGHHIHVQLDDASYEKATLYLFASVLEHFLSEFVSVNSFTEVSFSTPNEGEFAKWPPRTGRLRTI